MSLPEQDFIAIKNYLDPESCQLLIDYFNNNVATNNTNVNPRFSGRVCYYESIQDPKVKQIMKTIHDDVARRLKEFYEEEGEILPEATHIVKWPSGSSLGNHADNAYEDGTPNYVNWRTYSGVLYLNDNYEGGEFYFRDKAVEIKPEQGSLVAFTAGMKHVHGVKTVLNGTRYALPMWFCGERERAYPEYRSSEA